MWAEVAWARRDRERDARRFWCLQAVASREWRSATGGYALAQQRHNLATYTSGAAAIGLRGGDSTELHRTHLPDDRKLLWLSWIRYMGLRSLWKWSTKRDGGAR